MRSHVCVCSLVALLAGCHAKPLPQIPTAKILPLRTVHLYETGVAYFERSGDIGDPSSTTLPVPAGHLDDALKTLVILGPKGGGVVRGIEFGSSLSAGMARAQAGLPLEADAPITWKDLLSALKGSPVEITTATGKVSGRLIDVEETGPKETKETKEGDKKKDDLESLVLLLMTDKGEMRRVPANTVTGVKPLDPAYAARLGSSLDALSTRNASTPRPLGLLGTTKGPVTFGYIAETPVWRASYRLVFAPDRKSAVMQGWALLHNDTDETWSGVKVSLVNGRPDSFLFPLAAPRYARRTLVAPENELSTVPQLAQKTPDAIWGDHLEVGESAGYGGLGVIGTSGGGGGTGYGYGSGAGKIGTIGVTTGTSSLLSVGDLTGVATAEGVESGALFTYTLDGGLDLGAHKSALVPFLSRAIEAQPITWIDDGARSAVRLTNSTPQTLPAGTIAFFAAGSTSVQTGAFIGESGLDRLKPGERRFLEFGADLDVELERKDASVDEKVKKVRFVGDSLEEHFLRTRRGTWELSNHSGLARDVYVVLHLDRNSKLEGADAQDYDTAKNKPVAVFHVAAKSKVSRVVVSTEGLSRRTHRSALTYDKLQKLVAETNLTAEERAAITEVAARQKELEDAREQKKKNEEQIATVEKDLVRLRDHLKALGDKAGPNPFVKRIVDKEDELAALRKKHEAFDKDLETRANAVKTALQKLA